MMAMYTEAQIAVRFKPGYDARRTLGGINGGKACLRWHPAERALRAVMAARKRYGKPDWDLVDREAFREGWKRGFEHASGWK